jgi:septal ring factor EnvC (AmiA/AmiB activator)
MKQNWRVGILIVTCLMMNGCPGESERMANLAEKTVRSQNEANVANAKTQNNFVNLNREFQQERSNLQIERQSLNQQFQKLETDRSNLHRLRRSELAWAESLRFLAIVIAAIMPLFLCAYLVWAASQHSANQEEISSILIKEVTSPRPKLIAGQNLPAIEDRTDPTSVPGQDNA